MRVDADTGARMLARRLARTCRVLAAMQAARLTDENWDAAWDRACIEATALLGGESEVGCRADFDALSLERITLTDLGSCPPDRLTPILPPVAAGEPAAISGLRPIGSIRLARIARG